MNIKYFVCFLFLVSCFFVSCKNETSNVNQETSADSSLAKDPDSSITNNSQSNLQSNSPAAEKSKKQSVFGSYMAVLPCADCEGIKTMLVLNADNTYLIKTAHQKAKERTVHETKGKYEFNINSNKIILDGNNDVNQYSYMVSHIIQLDKNGNEIKSEKPEAYFLKKM
jgi:uncharacterized lipoprotein NlpE involved in copper resistance